MFIKLLLILQGILVPPQDSQGWTVINKSSDTTEIYVSSSTGNDLNNGTISFPLETVEEAFSRLDDGSADHIYLKRGDTWNGKFTLLKQGRSFLEPIVITSYGTGSRPLLKGIDDNAVFSNSWSDGGLENLWLIDIAFAGVGASDVVTLMNSSSNILVEGCEITGIPGVSDFCLVLDANNVVMRRNILHNSKQGLYAGWSSDFILLEQNYFFNFWDNNYSNWLHATYFDNENMADGHQPTVVISENVVGNVEHSALQARCSADIINNTVFHAGIGISFGGSDEYPEGCQMVRGDVILNVVLHGTTYTTPWSLCWGFITGHCDGVAFVGNLIANSDIDDSWDVTSPRAISLNGVSKDLPFEPAGVQNLNISNNVVYNWGEDLQNYSTGLDINCDPAYSFGINIQFLDVQEPYYSDWTWVSQGTMGYPFVKTQNLRLLGTPAQYQINDTFLSFKAWQGVYNDTTSVEKVVQYKLPQLTIPMYNQLVGGGQPTFEDFILRCEAQRKGMWKTEYTSKKINQIFRRAFTEQQ